MDPKQNLVVQPAYPVAQPVVVGQPQGQMMMPQQQQMMMPQQQQVKMRRLTHSRLDLIF